MLYNMLCYLKDTILMSNIPNRNPSTSMHVLYMTMYILISCPDSATSMYECLLQAKLCLNAETFTTYLKAQLINRLHCTRVFGI